MFFKVVDYQRLVPIFPPNNNLTSARYKRQVKAGIFERHAANNSRLRYKKNEMNSGVESSARKDHILRYN
jgi:hypothetical protein